jgi:hypothetical protein
MGVLSAKGTAVRQFGRDANPTMISAPVELPGARRPSELQEDRPTVGFNHNSEPKKAAAVTLGFDPV